MKIKIYHKEYACRNFKYNYRFFHIHYYNQGWTITCFLRYIIVGKRRIHLFNRLWSPRLQIFSGYLISGAHVHTSASEYICLDSDAEMLAGGVANTDGRVIYLVEGVCGTLKCPPYVQGRELTCVVCSK